MKSLKRGVVAGALVGICGMACGQATLLPDIIVTEDQLFDNVIENVGGQRYLRLSNGTANQGAGKLYLYGGQSHPDGTQDVIQRMYDTAGGFTERIAGQFIYHPGHGHIHVEDWCEYRLREVTAGGGVGEIIARGAKTSFCILDLAVYDSSLPGFPPGGQFRSCGTTIQGLSVGWMDIYGRGLEGQYINITNVADGQYWLESYVDPNDSMLEEDETNNATRILVTIGGGTGPIDPDAYEENDSQSGVDARTVGAANSPNLGPTGPLTVIPALTIDAPGDNDWFKFYLPAQGVSGDVVRIDFEHDFGDVDMRLRNAAGTQVASSTGTVDFEQISMSGRPAGWYYIEVYGYSGATHPGYALTINPSVNATPSVTVDTPPAGDTQRIHGTETYQVDFSANDVNGNLTWVTVWVNDTPTLDGTEILLPSSVNTPGSTGFYVINSAELDPGTYWVYAQVTDGGSSSGDWSQGTITFVDERCDADYSGSSDPNDPNYGVPDGTADSADFFFFLDQFSAGNLLVDVSTSADPNDPGYGVPDGMLDSADFFFFLDRFIEGC